MISECPSCNKRFLVTDEQIAQSNGIVRCGACMKPFKIQKTDDAGIPKEKGSNSPLSPEKAPDGDLQFQTLSHLASPKRRKHDSQDQAQNTSLPTNSFSERQRDDGRVEPVIPHYDPSINIGALSAQLKPEPIKFGDSSENTASAFLKTIKIVTSTFVAAALLFALFTQLTPLDPNLLNKHTHLQKIYTASCNFLKCGGKTPKGAYISRKLLVYSHPEKSNALMIESVIVNLSSSALPFPLLRFEFKNLQGKVIAGRQFTPIEYLDGELIGKQLFEPSSPIRIALEIKDPGKNAVNYEMLLIEPQPI